MQNRKNTTNYYFLRAFYLLSAIIFICSCQSAEKTNSSIIQFSNSEYVDVIENYTALAQEYDGLQNTLEFHATLLNSRVIEAQTLRKASMLQWDKTKYDQELTSRNAKSKETTEIFVSFFTPERKNNDLSRSETLWKTFLINKDGRYEGKVEKVSLLNSEIQSLYPLHNRWSNAYIVRFPTGVTSIENTDLEFVITGPVGNKSVHFKTLTK